MTEHRHKLDKKAHKVAKRWRLPSFWYWTSAFIMATVLFKAIWGKEIF